MKQPIINKEEISSTGQKKRTKSVPLRMTVQKEKDITTGAVTIPGEHNMSSQVKELAIKWGADAIRDSDGTCLDESFAEIGYQIYSTICLVRADQKFAKEHPKQLAGKYLMSEPVTARSERVEISLLSGYFKPKYRVNFDDDPKKWWEVVDRTTGQVVDGKQWEFDTNHELVILNNAQQFHVYTVSFLVYITWDPTSMYNHMINNWNSAPVISVDPYYTQTRRHLFSFFDKWLEDHSNTDVIRLTTLAYHFSLDSDELGKDKYRDWLGYTDCVSIKALEDFARIKGYSLRPEDFVDQGFYNSTNRVPSERYLDWMDFIQDFVVEFGRELVEKIHLKGKKAAIFWGDHWVGAEFYSSKFKEMGIDINIGACESGIALRRLADIQRKQTKEIRLYPYMFPDIFNNNCDPVKESQSNWIKIRRALLRKSVDRIGYGGYVSLSLKKQGFVEHVRGLCDEFRTIINNKGDSEPYSAPLKVAVLDAWGELRSWISHTSSDEKFNCSRPDTFEITGSNLLECLSGLPVEVRFINFDDIKENGISSDVDVIINDGLAGTAWSGGNHWKDPDLITTIRKWVNDGGGFIGVVDPSAYENNGKYFQLYDVIGVEKETGSSIGFPVSNNNNFIKNHFITADLQKEFDCGFEKNHVFCCGKETKLLSVGNERHVHLAVNNYGSGRSVYIAALPYSCDNSRLLLRSLLWAANKEDKLFHWFSANPFTDCAFYPEKNKLVVVNNSDEGQITIVFASEKQSFRFFLKPFEIKWFDINEINWSMNDKINYDKDLWQTDLISQKS